MNINGKLPTSCHGSRCLRGLIIQGNLDILVPVYMMNIHVLLSDDCIVIWFLQDKQTAGSLNETAAADRRLITSGCHHAAAHADTPHFR